VSQVELVLAVGLAAAWVQIIVIGLLVDKLWSERQTTRRFSARWSLRRPAIFISPTTRPMPDHSTISKAVAEVAEYGVWQAPRSDEWHLIHPDDDAEQWRALNYTALTFDQIVAALVEGVECDCPCAQEPDGGCLNGCRRCHSTGRMDHPVKPFIVEKLRERVEGCQRCAIPPGPGRIMDADGAMVPCPACRIYREALEALS
jgi:hypothetical protein